MANNLNAVAGSGTDGQFLGNTAGVPTWKASPAGPAGSVNFVAYKSSATANVTGDGTLYTVIFDSTVSNVGAAYNTGTGIFTAPNTGLYYFSATVDPTTFLVTHTTAQMQLIGSVNQYSFAIVNPFNVSNGANNNCQLSGSIAIPMTAGDTMKVTVTVSGGTKTCSVYGQALVGVYTFFTGYQIA